MGRASRQKINKDIQDLNSPITQLNVIDVYRLDPTAEEFTFLSGSQETLTKTGYILYMKHSLTKLKD